MKPMKPFYVVIIAIIVAAAAFYGGMQYEKSKTASFASNAGMMNGNGSRFGGQGGFGGRGFGGNGANRPVSGQIVSTDNNSITVKMPDGSSKIVNYSGQTKINKATEGSASDLKSGTNIAVFGTTNSDGSVTAQMISIGNGMMFRRGGGGNQTTPNQGQ